MCHGDMVCFGVVCRVCAMVRDGVVCCVPLGCTRVCFAVICYPLVCFDVIWCDVLLLWLYIYIINFLSTINIRFFKYILM